MRYSRPKCKAREKGSLKILIVLDSLSDFLTKIDGNDDGMNTAYLNTLRILSIAEIFYNCFLKHILFYNIL